MNKRDKRTNFFNLLKNRFDLLKNRLKIKNLKAKTFTRNGFAVFVLSIATIFVSITIWPSLTAIVFIAGMIFLIGSLLFLKTRDEYLQDYKGMSEGKKKLLISKYMNDLSNNYLSETISLLGLFATMYSAIKNPSYDFISSFAVVFYFYLAYIVVKTAKEKMFLDFVADDYENDKNDKNDVSIFIINNIDYKKLGSKSYQSKFKKFNRRRQR